MKTWKQSTFFGFLAVLVFVVALVACDNGNNENNETGAKTHTHDWGSWVIKTPATCISEGVETRTCILDSSHTETQSIEINPNAHNSGPWTVTIPATCSTTGEEIKNCTYCSEITETQSISTNPNEHSYNWVTTINETQRTDGVETGTCTYNPIHTETRTLYATGWGGSNFLITTGSNANTFAVRQPQLLGAGELYICDYYRDYRSGNEYFPVTEIGRTGDISNNGAFANTLITGIRIGNNIKIIHDYAFASCYSLMQITTLPSGLTYIGDFAFYDCWDLTEIIILAESCSLGINAFYGCTKLNTIKVPADSVDLYKTSANWSTYADKIIGIE